MVVQMKKNLVLVLIVSILIICTLFLTTVFSILYFSSPSSNPNISKKNNYIFTEVNIANNETRHGFVQLPQHLGREEYISYRNPETDSFFIISNYGGNEYECTGSCLCSSNSRRNSNILSRGLTVLLSAFSLSMATNIAKEAFRDECVKQFSDKCDEEEISSLIDQCIDHNSGEVSVNDRFHCTGHCYENPDLDHLFPDYRTEGFSEFGLCEGIVFEREIIPGIDVERVLGEPPQTDKMPAMIVTHLMFVHMFTVCNEATRMPLKDKEKNFLDSQDPEEFQGEEKERLLEMRKGLSFCVINTVEGGPPKYASIRCVKKKESVKDSVGGVNEDDMERFKKLKDEHFKGGFEREPKEPEMNN